MLLVTLVLVGCSDATGPSNSVPMVWAECSIPSLDRSERSQNFRDNDIISAQKQAEIWVDKWVERITYDISLEGQVRVVCQIYNR